MLETRAVDYDILRNVTFIIICTLTIRAVYIAGCYDAMEAAAERSYHLLTWKSPLRRILKV